MRSLGIDDTGGDPHWRAVQEIPTADSVNEPAAGQEARRARSVTLEDPIPIGQGVNLQFRLWVRPFFRRRGRRLFIEEQE